MVHTQTDSAAHAVQDKTDQELFMATILNLSWQLLIVVVLPFVGGHLLDVHYKTTPLWTLLGLGVALALAALSTYQAYKSLTAKQAARREVSNV